jgi:hypothetical protein
MFYFRLCFVLFVLYNEDTVILRNEVITQTNQLVSSRTGTRSQILKYVSWTGWFQSYVSWTRRYIAQWKSICLGLCKTVVQSPRLQTTIINEKQTRNKMCIFSQTNRFEVVRVRDLVSGFPSRLGKVVKNLILLTVID